MFDLKQTNKKKGRNSWNLTLYRDVFVHMERMETVFQIYGRGVSEGQGSRKVKVAFRQ